MEINNTLSKMICAVCGEEINGLYVKEYCQPPALHKWLKTSLSLYEYRELKELVLSRDNIIYVHEECSSEKRKERVNITTLHLGKSRKARIEEGYAKMKPYANRYRDMRGHIVMRQNRKCYQCGCDIKEKHSVLRRIDATKPRTEENGCLVCYDCDEKYKNFIHVNEK